jgi:hypothetical protein
MSDDDIVRVTVTMTRKQHKALKQYASFFGATQSDIVVDCLGYFWNKHYAFCTLTQQIFKNLNLAPDKRRQKPCYGHQCHQCTKSLECRVGKYSGVVVVDESCRPLMTLEGKRTLRDFQLAHHQAPQWTADLLETKLSHKDENHF